jgi:DNA-binding beta-propeller fold protein YncE
MSGPSVRSITALAAAFLFLARVPAAWPQGAASPQAGVASPQAGVASPPDSTGARAGFALKTEWVFDREALASAGIRRPMRIAYDSDGNLHVLDAETRKVTKLDSRGRMMYEVGGYGSDETSLELPVDIAIDRDQSLLVLDRGRASLLAFDRAGRFLAARAFQGAAAEEAREAGARILLDRFGQLWLLSPRARDLVPLDDQLMPARATRYLVPEDSVEAPVLAALHARGEAWVFDAASGLRRFDATGRLMPGGQRDASFGSGDAPSGRLALSDLAVDSQGMLFAADATGQRILVLDPGGTLILSRPLGGSKIPWRPEALAVGPNGTVAVADPSRCEIQVLGWVKP